MGVLDGIRIVEIAGLGPGPFCGMLLADMGAEVILVERASANANDPIALGKSAIIHRGKRSLALDLKDPLAIEAVLRLTDGADALIEGMRPGVMERLGLGRPALEEAVRYAKDRRQHGKVIAGHQLIAGMLADMATQVDASRLLVYRAASMIEAGVPAEMEAAMAKYFACEAAVTVARQAVQIHGGNGVTREFLVEKLARDAIVVPIPEGTSQIQQLLIARSLTGVNAF